MEGHAPSQTKTILLVDDEEQLMFFIEKLLIKEGYRVILASNGKEAVDTYKADSGSIDLVLMDIVMPVMSGVEACNELLTFDPDASILLMSAYPKDSFECFEQMNFIQKPMHPTDLFSIIGTIFNSTHPS